MQTIQSHLVKTTQHQDDQLEAVETRENIHGNRISHIIEMHLSRGLMRVELKIINELDDCECILSLVPTALINIHNSANYHSNSQQVITLLV